MFPIVENTAVFSIENHSAYVGMKLEETMDNSSSPVSCKILRFYGVGLLILFLSSMTSNVALMRMFYTNKRLQTPVNTFVIALTVLNTAGNTFEMPFSISSNLACK